MLAEHEEFKAEKSGIFFKKMCSYITALPDRLASCKCHRKALIEIKCSFSIRDKKIRESVNDCEFLKVSPEGNIFLFRSHRYYTQVISQMIVVWTPKDLSVQDIPFNVKHWQEVSITLNIFYKMYVCPALLNFQPITFCGRCDKMLLQEREINENESELNSIQCDMCSARYHFSCESIVESNKNDDAEWYCSNCLIDFSCFT